MYLRDKDASSLTTANVFGLDNSKAACQHVTTATWFQPATLIISDDLAGPPQSLSGASTDPMLHYLVSTSCFAVTYALWTSTQKFTFCVSTLFVLLADHPSDLECAEGRLAKPLLMLRNSVAVNPEVTLNSHSIHSAKPGCPWLIQERNGEQVPWKTCWGCLRYSILQSYHII